MANNNNWTSYLTQLEDQLNLYLGKKAPQLPENWKETIVKVSPWITLVLLILTAPIILAVLGIGAVMSPFAFVGGVHAGFGYIVTIVASIVMIILEAMSIPGLMKREKRGWNLIFYSTLIGGLQNLLTFSLGSLIIGTGLGLYILFQIRSHYK